MAGPLPYELKFREPHPRSIKAVADFARETGDLHGLSAVDLKVGDDLLPHGITLDSISYHIISYDIVSCHIYHNLSRYQLR